MVFLIKLSFVIARDVYYAPSQSKNDSGIEFHLSITDILSEILANPVTQINQRARDSSAIFRRNVPSTWSVTAFPINQVGRSDSMRPVLCARGARFLFRTLSPRKLELVLYPKREGINSPSIRSIAFAFSRDGIFPGAISA